MAPTLETQVVQSFEGEPTQRAYSPLSKKIGELNSTVFSFKVLLVLRVTDEGLITFSEKGIM